MKEYFSSAEYHRYFVAQQQAFFLIIAFQAYVETRSLTKTIMSLLVFIWLGDGFYNLHTVFTGPIGIVLGVLTVLVVSSSSTTTTTTTLYRQLYYYVVQPGILYYVMGLYVDQTEFPLGVCVGLILWWGCHTILWIGDETMLQRPIVYTLVFPVLVFFFTAVLSTHQWLQVIIAASIQLFFLAVNIILRFCPKKRGINASE